MKLYKSARRYYAKDRGCWYKITYHPEVKLQVIRIIDPTPHIDLRESSPLEVLIVTGFSLDGLQRWIERVDLVIQA